MKIRLENVVKTFETFRAVRDVSLTIESGELVALLGPSGSGKTTILRMVAGLEYADGGHIYFGEQDATDIPVRDRGVGFVFQHYALFPHMTVGENIAFGMKVSKVKRTKQEIAARVADLLRLVKLEGLGNRFPTQISGGQRQRVALARRDVAYIFSVEEHAAAAGIGELKAGDDAQQGRLAGTGGP